MKLIVPPLCAAVFFSSCASRVFNYPTEIVSGADGRSQAVSRAAIKFSGIDSVGAEEIHITRGSLSYVQRDVPANSPVEQRVVTNKRGEVIGVESRVIVAGHNSSNTTNAIHNLWSGVAKQAIGAAAAAWTAIGLANAASASTIATVNTDAASKTAASAAAAKTAGMTTKAGVATHAIDAGVSKAGIAADVTKATFVAP